MRSLLIRLFRIVVVSISSTKNLITVVLLKHLMNHLLTMLITILSNYTKVLRLILS